MLANLQPERKTLDGIAKRNAKCVTHNAVDVFEKISETRGLSEYPHLEAYMQRILTRPAAQKAEALEREHDQERD